MSYFDFKRDIKKQTNLPKAKFLQRFFKTGRGSYAEGDKFLGLTVPQSRILAKKHSALNFHEIKKLLESKFHEERLIGLIILVEKFKKEPQRVYNFYIANTKFVNNWDLVDLSADKIVGEYLLHRSKNILNKLAKSKNIWNRRIAIVSTYQFIRNHQFDKTIEIARLLLNDKHDLIHKAVGWMLREVGKRDEKVLIKFLDKYKSRMPRTSLRYAIERFPEKRRLRYLA
jgi:3-methyladenine DNA glycosylase AlkD